MTLHLRLFTGLLVILLGYGSVARADFVTINSITPDLICGSNAFTLKIIYSSDLAVRGRSGELEIRLYDQNIKSLKSLATIKNISQLPGIDTLEISLSGMSPGFYYLRMIFTTVNTIKFPGELKSFSVVNVPSKPIVSSVTYCQDAKPSALTSETTGSLVWYDNNKNPYEGGRAPIPSTENPGTTTFFVTQTINGCPSDFASVTVTVKEKPKLPDESLVPSRIEACQNRTFNFKPDPTLKWYIKNTTTTESVFSLPVTTSPSEKSYWVSQKNNTGCESDRKQVTVKVNTLPVTPKATPRSQPDCQGTASPTVLTASNLTGSSQVNWYKADLTPLPAPYYPLTSNTGSFKYYVTQTDNATGCTSLRDSITVTVNARPASANVTSPAPAAVCQGTPPVSLTTYASATDGNSLLWYKEDGTTPVTTLSVSTSATSTYQVRQQDNIGCVSNPVQVTVSIKDKPLPPAVTSPTSFCKDPVSGQALGQLTAQASANGSIRWYGTDSTQASTGPVPPPILTTTTSATANYYVSQTVNGCESYKATIAVTIKEAPTGPTVTGEPAAFCQDATASALSANGTGVLNWYETKTGGEGQASVIPKTNETGTRYYYVSQTVNGCESVRTPVAYSVIPKPQPPIITTAVALSYCQGKTAEQLSAKLNGGTSLNWYAVNQNSGSSSSQAPTPSTSQAGTNIYYVSQSDAKQCASTPASITVTVNAIPPAPNVTDETVISCQGTTPVSLSNAASGTGLQWYGPTGNLLSGPPTPPTSTTGVTQYAVTQTINGCTSKPASITVTVNQQPQKPGSSPVSLCLDGASKMLTATGQSLQWYDPAGQVLPGAPTPPTSATGTFNYAVTQTVNGCASPKAVVAVTVLANPPKPTISAASLSYCQSTTATSLSLSVTPTAGGSLNWYDPDNQVLTVAPTPSTADPGARTYYVSQTVKGCTGQQAAIVVNVQATPLVPTIDNAPVYCQGTTAPLSATPMAGGTLIWYTASSGGTGTSTPPTLPPTATSGSVTYYVSQSVNGCEGPRVALKATIRAAPLPPTATDPAPYCLGGAPKALAAKGQNIKWYTAETGGTGSAAAPTPTATSVGETLFYVSQTDAYGCESTRATITVQVNALPTAPVTTPARYCQGSTAGTLTVSGAQGALKWYDSGENALGSNAPTPSTDEAGFIKYYVTQTDAATGCESPRAELVVTVNPAPVAPVPVPDDPVCQGTTPVALSAVGQNLKWYADNNPTSASLGSTVLQMTTAAGTFSYYVSQTVNGCESDRTLVQQSVKPRPSALLSQQISYCQNALPASLAVPGANLKWYDSAGGGVSTTPAPPSVSTTYLVSQTMDGCESEKSSVSIVVNAKPEAPANQRINYCQNNIPAALLSTIPNLNWYTENGSAISEPEPPTSTTNYFISQTDVNGCESDQASVTVTLNSLPTATLTGTAVVSLGMPTALSLELTGTGTTSYTLSDGTTGSVELSTNNPTTRKITVTPRSTTTYAITELSNACGDGVASGTATITVNIPVISTANPTKEVVCTGESFGVPFSVVGEFLPGNTFTVEIASATGDSSARRFIPISNRVGPQERSITATIPPNFPAGRYQIRVVASNGNFPVQGLRSPVTMTVRGVSTANFGANRTVIYKGEGAELYFTLTGDGPWSLEYMAGSDVVPKTASDNLLRETVNPSVTTTYKLKSVSNVCGPGIIIGHDTVTIRVDPLLGEPDPFNSAVKVYPVPTQGTVTVDIDLTLHREPAELQLTDLNGRLTKNVVTRQRQTTLSLENQPAGTYQLLIRIGNRTAVRRILKR